MSRRRRRKLPLPRRLRCDPPPLPFLVGRREVFGEMGDGAAEAVQAALGYALQGVTESDLAWEPGHVLVVISSSKYQGGQTSLCILPTELALVAAPWLDDEQRRLTRLPLPIDERRVILWVDPGHVATARYHVPSGRTSN